VSDEDQPLLRVVRGNPTAEELAALTAVIVSRAHALSAAGAQPPARSAWTDRSRLVRRSPCPGPGAWRSSSWPG
jgi:hypothetical protein